MTSIGPIIAMKRCKHCGVEIEQHAPGSEFWAHIVGPGSRLNRCQHPDIPYGHEAHPVGTECPSWCLGHKSAEQEQDHE